MAKKGRSAAAYGIASLLALSLMLAAGCDKGADMSGTSSAGGPTKDTSGRPLGVGMSGGPGGAKAGPGGPGGTTQAGGIQLSATAAPTEIMEKSCQCHGAGGKGGNAPVIAGGAGKTDEQLIAIITNGEEKMPAFKDKLTEDQIKSVAAHLKTLK